MVVQLMDHFLIRKIQILINDLSQHNSNSLQVINLIQIQHTIKIILRRIQTLIKVLSQPK